MTHFVSSVTITMDNGGEWIMIDSIVWVVVGIVVVGIVAVVVSRRLLVNGVCGGGSSSGGTSRGSCG